MFLFALLGPAMASYTVASPPFTEKSDATALTRRARDAGHKGRVVRRFVEGEGWEYVVQWSFDELDEANAAAHLLREQTGQELELTAEDGAPIESQPAPVEPVAERRDWMGEALEVHGGGAATLADAETVRVVFVRTLEDGRKARHTYVRRGTDQRLAIEPVEGTVKRSVTVAVGESAWLEVDDGRTVQDLQRTREKLEAFALPSLAPLVLALDRAVQEHPELDELVARGTAKVDGVRCEVAGSRDGATLIAFGPDHLVRRLSVDGGARVYEFSDYREVDGVRIPNTIIRRIGESDVETTEIETVDLDGEVDPAWFEPAG